MKQKPLSEYEAKRVFEETPEPGSEVRSDREGPLLFVIQKHDATRLHYDLRLELDGVLKSWAVPKGISYDPDQKHMAVQVEDHPIDYGSFEGQIPAGQYGAGEVIVWDTGTYWCDEDDDLPQTNRKAGEAAVRKGLEDGKLSFFLRGTKLKGSWALIKMKQGAGWLLIRHKDRYHLDKQPDYVADDDSVLSGLSIADLQRGKKAGKQLDVSELIPSGRHEALPKKLMPMMAHLANHSFDDPDWVFEPKLDGVRVLATIERDEVRLCSRNGLDNSVQFPSIRESLKQQKSQGMILDGEIVAFENGVPSFQSMLKRLHLKDAGMLAQMDRTIPCVFYVFDLLHFEGANLRGLPLSRRRRYLEQAFLPTDLLQMVSQVPEDGVALFEAVSKAGFEGVVAKKANSIYEAGKRSKCWLKVKHTKSAEFVVGGYSKGLGGREDTFGALLVGYYEDGKLKYSGHVGSGFNDENLPEIKTLLDSMRADKNPFSEKPPAENPVTWVEPKIVVEVKYHQITEAGIMRAPVFLRVREDVDPKKVGPIPDPVEVEEPHAQVDPADETPITPKGGSAIEAVLEQLDNKQADIKLEVEGHTIGLTNLNKILWPANEEAHLPEFTKRDLIAYLAQVSPYMIPHTKDRPLTMIRFPEGIHGEKFFQKHWDHKVPDFVESVTLFSESVGVNQRYLMANNLPSVLWLGQLGTLEFHVWGSRCVGGEDADGIDAPFIDTEENIEHSILNYPDFIKFDLDPYVYSGKEKQGDEPELHKEGFEKGKTVAYWLKQLLDSMGLESFVKTTGKTGLHIFVPIVRDIDYAAVREISGTICRGMEAEHPKDITTQWSTEKRTGKIFMDYNMNVRSKTLNSPYSPRALPNQAVSMPVTWEELRNAYPTDFLMRNSPEFLKDRGDVWAKILYFKHDVAAVLG